MTQAGATIIDGVTIGHDSIVTAGSVVITNVPPYGIAKGSPARVVHDRRELAAQTGGKTSARGGGKTSAHGGGKTAE